jgi:hypothetical protein
VPVGRGVASEATSTPRPVNRGLSRRGSSPEVRRNRLEPAWPDAPSFRCRLGGDTSQRVWTPRPRRAGEDPKPRPRGCCVVSLSTLRVERRVWSSRTRWRGLAVNEPPAAPR